ncbi:AAA family ATPase [Vibrio sp. 10N.286.51.F4]|uniref:ATP-binding protein n=1 Tax=Vibrio sp. 10N.286.51.F4 TaxID=3229710 RepID=UPI00354C8ACF
MNNAETWQDNNPYFIKTIRVDDLLNSKSLLWNVSDVNVLVGRNGSGKSTLLELVRASLYGPEEFHEFKFMGKFSNLVVTLNNGMESRCSIIDSLEHENQLLTTIRTMLEKNVDNDDEDINNLKRVYNTLMHKKNSEKPTGKKMMSGSSEFLLLDENESKVNTLLQNINVEFISTFDMILMSKEEQDTHTDNESEGTYSQLDIMLNKELMQLSRLISRLKSKSTDLYNLQQISQIRSLNDITDKNMTNIKSLLKTLNDFFSKEEKMFALGSDGFLEIKKDNRKILPKSLSSGEKQLLYIFMKVINGSDKPMVLFLDEPEISMHLSWQEKLLDALKIIHPNLQIIAVSHSPALVMNGWFSNLNDIDEISNKTNH